MNSSPTDIQIAQSLECDPALLPFLPYLLQDIEELGGMSEYLYSVLAPQSLPPESRALDLGCGKGVIACELAKRFGWNVRGVDLFEPFVADAKTRAQKMGVAHRCRFECGDAREAVKNSAPMDVLILFSVGRLFGTIHDTIGELRQAVKPGGFLAIEEVFLAPGAQGPTPLYNEQMSRETVLCELTDHGDRIVNSHEYLSADVARWNRWSLERIERRVGEMCVQHPEMASAFQEYADTQRRACEEIDRQLVCGVWLLERAAN